MFKKLKQKIEEGGDGGIEKVSFSQRRFPGSAVRTLSQSGEEETRQVEEQPAAAVEEEESRDEGQGVVLNDSGGPLITGVGVVSGSVGTDNKCEFDVYSMIPVSG